MPPAAKGFEVLGVSLDKPEDRGKWLDPDGKIIAKYLRGEALEMDLKKVMP